MMRKRWVGMRFCHSNRQAGWLPSVTLYLQSAACPCHRRGTQDKFRAGLLAANLLADGVFALAWYDVTLADTRIGCGAAAS